MNDKQPKKRTAVPAGVKRQVLFECGFMCPVRGCHGQWPALQTHHIDGNPSNHDPANILLLCPTHHQLFTSGYLDRKMGEIIKKYLSDSANIPVTPDVNRRAMLLYTLMAETLFNRNVLKSECFLLTNKPLNAPIWYPRLQPYVVREARGSGLFNTESDRPLFSLISDTLEVIDGFNQRLCVAEFTMFGPLSGPDIIETWRRAMCGAGRDHAHKGIVALGDLLVARYSQEGCFDGQTQFLDQGVREQPGASTQGEGT